MLKIQKDIEYALLALRYIFQNQGKQNISAKEISETLGIPYELLSKILQRMVKSGLIISQQGKFGGYNLSEKPDHISFSKVIESLNHKIQLTECMYAEATKDDCKRFDGCCLRSPLSQIQNKIIELFDKTTLRELLN